MCFYSSRFCLSGGYKPYAIALLTHFGHWVSQVSESGRKLRDRWCPLPQLTYAQVVNRRRRKRLVSVTRRVVYGTLEAVQAKLMASVGKVINTAFIERLNLMLRQRVPALARRTLAVAKNEVGLQQELNLTRGYYNFVVPHGSLRQRLPESNDSAKKSGNSAPQQWPLASPTICGPWNNCSGFVRHLGGKLYPKT